MSQKLVFHQTNCICAIKRILSTTVMYASSSSFIYLRIPCYCDACLNSSALRVGVKALLNTIHTKYNKIFVITCESVGTVDSMCFPWQQQSAQG